MKCRKFMRLRKKLESTAGESLVEVLVSLLIAALAILMLGQSVSASVRMIRNSGSVLEDYYAAVNVLAERPSDVEHPAVTSGEALVSITCKRDGNGIADYPSTTQSVKYYVNQASDSNQVVSYGIAD